MTISRKMGRWAGLKVARRVGKSIPFVGTAVAIYLLRDAVKRKGLLGGVIHSGLDAVPYFGALKNGIELFTDDWIPDLSPGDRIIDAAAVAVPDPPTGPPDPTSRTRS
jgi:hypothetical protein